MLATRMFFFWDTGVTIEIPGLVADARVGDLQALVKKGELTVQARTGSKCLIKVAQRGQLIMKVEVSG